MHIDRKPRLATRGPAIPYDDARPGGPGPDTRSRIPMSIDRYRLLNLVLLAALFAGSAWAYPRLPGRIPMHFDLSGQPDRWAERSLFNWFLLPVFTAVLALFLHWIAGVAARNPHTWNVPDKGRFLAMSPGARAPIVARMQAFVAFVSVVVTLLMSAIQFAIFQAATEREPEPSAWMLGVIGVTVAVILVCGLRLNGRVGRMIRDRAEATGD